MSGYDGWLTDGDAWGTHAGAIWIKRYGDGSAMQWLGNCARLDDGTEARGAVNLTHKFSSDGGVQVHQARAGIPDTSSIGLAMKKIQYDRKSNDIKRCWWIVDDRSQCDGYDRDSWNKWQEITRYCGFKATDRTISGTDYEGDNEDRMVTIPMSGLSVLDLRRVTGEIGTLGGTEQVTDIAVLQGARCPNSCDDQEDCVVIAVTQVEDGAANSYAFINYNGGDLDQWGAAITLTDFGANDATAVAGAREFVVIVSDSDASVIYSYDRLTTQINDTTTDLTAHAPLAVDTIGQALTIIGGSDGYVYRSVDGMRTIETVTAGGATASDISDVAIARSNPQVIYGASNAGDIIIRSENGGNTWYAQAATGGGNNITALWVDPTNHNHVIVGTDAGEIYESEDGAQSWTEQNDLDGIGTKANATIAKIVGCGCGDLGLITENSSDDERYFYRNVENGASGRWFQPAEYEAVATGDAITSLACCGPNHFIAGGGTAGADDFILLLA